MTMIHDTQNRIRLRAYPTRVRVVADEAVIADTSKAMELDEQGYPARLYIPREDIVSGRLRVAEKRTHCPFKGDATYYDIQLDDGVLAEAAWCYDAPVSAVADIAGHVAFDHPGLSIED